MTKRALSVPTALLVCVPSLPHAAQVSATGIEEARTFLSQYATQSYLQSARILDLYSDRAVVRTRSEREQQARVFEGRVYKRWVREALDGGKAGLDASQFRQATVERRGQRLVIRAQRYSANRCYWDAGYLVGIEREGARWVIVEERMTTRPDARCPAAQDGTAPTPAATLRYDTSTRIGLMSAAPAEKWSDPALVARTSSALQVPWNVGVSLAARPAALVSAPASMGSPPAATIPSMTPPLRPPLPVQSAGASSDAPPPALGLSSVAAAGGRNALGPMAPYGAAPGPAPPPNVAPLNGVPEVLITPR